MFRENKKNSNNLYDLCVEFNKHRINIEFVIRHEVFPKRISNIISFSTFNTGLNLINENDILTQINFTVYLIT
jgi:hypothetical protein